MSAPAAEHTEQPAGPRGVWRLVAVREMTTRVREKTFIGATVVTLVFLVGFFVVTTVLGANANKYDVAVTSGDDTGLVTAAQAMMRDSGIPGADLTVTQVADQAAAEDAVRGGDADVALVRDGDAYRLVGDDGIDDGLGAALTSAVATHAVTTNADSMGVDLAELNAGSQVDRTLLDPNAAESDARAGVAFAFALVFFMTALGFGMTIAQSVAQEKESRVVEILAAAVPIRSLLWGKIAGNTVLALGQVLLIVVVGLVGLAVTGRTGLLAGISLAVVWYVAFFLLGFVTLAALWSVAGALASRQEDLQATTMPGQMILLIPYFVAIFGSDQVRTIISMLPIVSTLVMPGRMAEGPVPWWQVAVGIVLTVAAAVVFVRVGSRLYERTLLRTGGRIGYREAFRLST